MKKNFVSTLKLFLATFLFLSTFIAFVPIPKFIVKEIILENIEYFYNRPEYFSQNHSFLQIKKMAFHIFDWKVKQIWLRGIRSKLEKLKTPSEKIDYAIKYLQNQMANQNEVHHPPLATSSLASLIRGYGYCDQINTVLGLVLHDFFENVQIVGLVDERGRSPHTTVKLSLFGSPIFADAWHAISVFSFDPVSGISDFHEIKDQLTATYSINEQKVISLYQNSVVINQHDLSFQLKKLVRNSFGNPIDVGYGSGTEIDSKPALKQPDNSSKKKAITTVEERRSYLEARIEHLFGNQRKAQIQYQNILDNQNCTQEICNASIYFIQKILSDSQRNFSKQTRN